jgi:hypothetical protein
VQLRADSQVPYGRVAELIGLVQDAGLSRIGFVTGARRAEPWRRSRPRSARQRGLPRRPARRIAPPTIRRMNEKYVPAEVESAARAALERDRRLPRDRGRVAPKFYACSMLPYPQRQAAHGARAQLHHQRHADRGICG